MNTVPAAVIGYHISSVYDNNASMAMVFSYFPLY